ncbi:MAG: TatD family hydrolase [Anaerolineales bacterium]
MKLESTINIPLTTLPTLDAHAHLDPSHTSEELTEAGPVLAMTLSLAEADRVLLRQEPLVAWGVGCHPRKLAAQQAFDPAHFAELAANTAVIGEIGLDIAYQVPFELQLRIFRAALRYASQNPHIVSIHSFRTTSQVLEELSRTPVIAPILHWWTGNATETRRAVELGCYFSVHSAVARRSLFRTQVPPERLLVESDHGWANPPGASPHRIAWVEYLLSASLHMDVHHVRQLVWHNFSEMVRLTGTSQLLPPGLSNLLP